MVEISWGELAVVTGLTFAVIGKRDLPRAAGYVGEQLGRIVGLLQGARARADRFTQQNELRQLHTELRAGLRELDVVKSEIAVSMSSRGMVGRQLMTPTLPKTATIAPQMPTTAAASTSASSPQSTSSLTPPPTSTAGLASSMAQQSPLEAAVQQPTPTFTRALPPKNQTVAAVVEEEWEKQGIAFKSRAERGTGLIGGYGEQTATTNTDGTSGGTSGSALLANLIQQTLIFDQYDRVVQEQDAVLQTKIDTIQQQHQEQKNQQQKQQESSSSSSKEEESKTE